MKYSKAIVVFVIFLATFTCLKAQVNVLASKMVCSNDSATWTLQFRVEKGFYVLAPDNESNDGMDYSMKITWTSLPEQLRPVKNIDWPPSNFHGQQSVYTEGVYTVKQVFVVNRKKLKGPAFLEGKISFQGCEEDRCYPPEEILFKTSLLKR